MDEKTEPEDHVIEQAEGKPKTPLLSSSIQGATFLILLQIGSRGLTFAVNQVLIRHLSPELLGVSTQLELYQISVLYFARESLRVALQRQANDTEEEEEEEEQQQQHASEESVPNGVIGAESPAGKAQTIINLSYISLLSGLLLAVGLAKLYLHSTSSSLQTPWFRESLYLYGLAAFLELLAEPCFILAQHKLLYKVRAGAESVATLSKCLATCASALFAARRKAEVGVLPFAVGQMAYALVLLAVYYWRLWGFARNEGFSLMLKPIVSRTPSQYLFSYFSRPLLSLAGSIFLQSSIKHLLTQGDSLLIATLASLRDQGIYALTANYGGLIARTLFQPIEESSRTLFSKLLSSPTTASTKPDRSRVHTAARVLSTILRLYLLLAIIAVSLGPSLAPVLLQLVAGDRWISSGAGDVLGTYSYYVPLLALNGVTEAFISAVATPAELHAQSVWMVAFSLGFAGAGLVFLRWLGWAAQGLVWANVVNMLLRVVWSTAFIRSYFGRNAAGFSLTRVLPTPGAVAVGVGVATVASRMHDRSTDLPVRLVSLASVGGAAVLLIATFERVFIRQCLDMLDSSNTTSKEAKES
ncbi:MAG: Oligosaccharide translocation protein rft1 [Peltula sp. TS41687]|nr:MAG: Oligosaccharide translocation protein rft1 [Peltula sp. TS41687]